MRWPAKGLLENPLESLDSIKGDIFELKPRVYDRSFFVLLLIDRKTRNRWALLLINKAGPIIFSLLKLF